MEALQWIFSTGIDMSEAVQLKEELDSLRETLPMARILINSGEWGRFKNKNLAELLSHLRDTTHDAEDLLRELDDEELRQHIEDVGRSRAGQLLSSSLTVAKRFIYGYKKRVKEIQVKLKNSMEKVHGMLSFLGLNVESAKRRMPETSSVISADEVFGRDSEREALMDKLDVMIDRGDERDQVIENLGVPVTRSAKSNGKRAKAAADSWGASTSRPAKRPKGQRVSVIPIVGIGGVGKTTLAQVIYNDSRVKRHFGVRIWVCVSDVFDKKRMTREIVESISRKKSSGPCSFNALREELLEQLKRRRFLLVLDDIWPNANSEWEEFYAPLSQGFEGSKILVTTRYPMVADHINTNKCKHVQLGGLPHDIFWEFFRKCAFGDREQKSELQVIGKIISLRLCGSPLAAKTLGRLLSMELTVEHWRTIQNSELWQLQHKDNEILPALRLSYLYLQPEHKRCFAFCSMFPKDYSFQRHKLVDIWVAEGFVVPEGTRRLEDVGTEYLDELRSRFLFQTDPKFPNQNRYVMHDLIHDMAQSVSEDECFLMQDSSHLDQRRVPQTVRHMSVEMDDESLSRVREIQHLNKLRSLRFRPRFNVEITYFNQLTNILFLSLKGCKLEKLHESICELNSIRYLDISHSKVRELPEKFWRLCNLQVLDATRSSLQTVHRDVTKLVNLRQLALPSKANKAFERASGIGNLSNLRNLRQFIVGKANGRRIDELKGMNQLSGTLTILELHHVQSKEEASEARLADKQYLNVLDLQWRFSHGALRSNDVIEGLRPHQRIEHLKVSYFDGDRYPSWLNPQDLPNLKSLELSFCDHASSCISGSSLSHLTALHLHCCSDLKDLSQFLSPTNLPSLRSMNLKSCFGLVSVAAHNFVGFSSLQDLKIGACHKLVCPREMLLPSSLRRLDIWSCGELDKSFPGCLENLTSLTFLKLFDCHNVKFIPLSSIASTKTLKYLSLCDCPELSSIEAPHCLSSIQYVKISECPKLTEVEQPFETNILTKKEKELLESW